MKDTLDTRDIKHVLLDKDNARRFLYLDALCPCLGNTIIARIANEAAIALKNDNKWTASTVYLVRTFFPFDWYESESKRLLPQPRHQFCLEAANVESLCLAIVRVLKRIKYPTEADRENLIYLAIYSRLDIPLPLSCGEKDVQRVARDYLSHIPFTDDWLITRKDAYRRSIATAACRDLLHRSYIWESCALCIREFESFSMEIHELSDLRCELGVWRNKPFTKCLVAGERKRVHQFLGIEATLQGRYADALPHLQEREPLLLDRFPMAEMCLQLSRLASGDEIEQLENDFSNDFKEMLQHRESESFKALQKLYTLRYPAQHDSADKALDFEFGIFQENSSILGTILKYLVLIDNHSQPWTKVCMYVQRNLQPLLPVASAMLRDILRAAGEELPHAEVDDIPHADLPALLPGIASTHNVENRLEALLNILSQSQKKQKAQKPQRLAWFLDPKFGEAIPKVQKQKSNGEWTSGQRLAAKRLVIETDTLDFLEPQDRQVAATYSVHGSYYGSNISYHFTPEKGLPQLAGHPLLFREGCGEPITLRVEPRPACDTGNGTLVLGQTFYRTRMGATLHPV